MPLTRQAAEMIELGRGGSYSVSRDAIKHTVYDSQLVPAVTADFTYFAQPIGSVFGAGVKSLAETNLHDNGKLPNGQTFLGLRLGVSLLSHSAAAAVDGATVVQAFTNILQASIFEIKLQGREYDFQCHGSQFTPAVSVSTISAATIFQHGSGQYLASGWINLDPSPVFLDQMVSFSVIRRCPVSPIAAVAAIITANHVVLNTNSAYIQAKIEGFLTRAK